ncbi:MAG: hypothetical protein ACI9BW_002468 [Gammaproteobacteria bacterium]|jgi:hypothetical protein
MTDDKYIEISNGAGAAVPLCVDDEARSRKGASVKSAPTIKRVVVGISVLLFFVVLGVIFVLPKFLGVHPPARGLAGTKAPTEMPNRAEPVGADRDSNSARSDRLRASSQALLEKALKLAGLLESHNVVEWAASEFSSAKANIDQGEKSYREQHYAAAEKTYTNAIEKLEAIGSRKGMLVEEAIKSGFNQITQGHSEQARKAFTFALSIEPEQSEAREGLARAETLDQVLALVNEAKGYEDIKALDDALLRYREALDLDAQMTKASNSITRINTIKLDDNYRNVMSQGFAAYDAKRDQEATKFFAHASDLKPNAGEAREALSQVRNRILANTISRHLRDANKLEANEQWSESAKKYRAAASLDPDLLGARSSATNADNRSALDTHLRNTIDRPDRLADNSVRKEALTLLSSAQSVSNPGPKLSRQIQQLALAIEIARTPIPVTLISDELTEVTLYKVGTLGHFAQQSVSVIPGRYVVVGKRIGFRDVRVEFEVSPEQKARTILVRCEQKLAFGSSGS